MARTKINRTKFAKPKSNKLLIDKDNTAEDVVFAETGKDFQEYVYADGTPVPAGTAIGVEKEDGIKLFPNIYYSNR